MFASPFPVVAAAFVVLWKNESCIHLFMHLSRCGSVRTLIHLSKLGWVCAGRREHIVARRSGSASPGSPFATAVELLDEQCTSR